MLVRQNVGRDILMKVYADLYFVYRARALLLQLNWSLYTWKLSYIHWKFILTYFLRIQDRSRGIKYFASSDDRWRRRGSIFWDMGRFPLLPMATQTKTVSDHPLNNNKELLIYFQQQQKGFSSWDRSCCCHYNVWHREYFCNTFPSLENTTICMFS